MTRKRSTSRRLSAMVSVRFTPEEEQAIRAAAAERGQSVSDFLRSAAVGIATTTTGQRCCANCGGIDELAFTVITGDQRPTIHFGSAPFSITGIIRWAGWRCQRCCMRDYGVFARAGYVA